MIPPTTGMKMLRLRKGDCQTRDVVLSAWLSVSFSSPPEKAEKYFEHISYELHSSSLAVKFKSVAEMLSKIKQVSFYSINYSQYVGNVDFDRSLNRIPKLSFTNNSSPAER